MEERKKEKGGRRGIAVSLALKARGLRVKRGDGKKKVEILGIKRKNSRLKINLEINTLEK